MTQRDRKLLPLIVASVLFGATAAADASPYTITLEQVGSNVVATGTGALDLTGLNLLENIIGAESFIKPEDGRISFGGFGGVVDGYQGPLSSGPASFGSGTFSPTLNATGDFVGETHVLTASSSLDFFLEVPHGYMSDTALSDSATWDSATLASLGVTPGTYVWTWGSKADQSFTLNAVGPDATTPLPATLPLFATGLGGLGVLGWRKKRKRQAAII